MRDLVHDGRVAHGCDEGQGGCDADHDDGAEQRTALTYHRCTGLLSPSHAPSSDAQSRNNDGSWTPLFEKKEHRFQYPNHPEWTTRSKPTAPAPEPRRSSR